MAKIDDIKTWVDLELRRADEAIEKIKSRSRKWQIGLGIAVVLLAVLLWTVFKKHKDSIDSSNQSIEALKRNNLFIDSLMRKKDTLYIENRKTETKVITRYEKIPAAVRDLTKDQLRDQVTNY